MLLEVNEEQLTILKDQLGDFLRGCRHRRGNVERLVRNSGLSTNIDTQITTPILDAQEKSAKQLYDQVLTLKVNFDGRDQISNSNTDPVSAEDAG